MEMAQLKTLDDVIHMDQFCFIFLLPALMVDSYFKYEQHL